MVSNAGKPVDTSKWFHYCPTSRKSEERKRIFSDRRDKHLPPTVRFSSMSNQKPKAGCNAVHDSLENENLNIGLIEKIGQRLLRTFRRCVQLRVGTIVPILAISNELRHPLHPPCGTSPGTFTLFKLPHPSFTLASNSTFQTAAAV